MCSLVLLSVMVAMVGSILYKMDVSSHFLSMLESDTWVHMLGMQVLVVVNVMVHLCVSF
jgi:hypothetical protein